MSDATSSTGDSALSAAEQYAARIAGDSENAPLVPRVQRWADTEPDWNAVEGSEQDGNRRGLYPRVYGSNVLGRFVTVPPGQASLKHVNSGEHLVIQIQGTAEFVFPDTPGQQPLRIGPRDVLFFPANIPYLYRNVGEDDVLWFTVLSPYQEWPPTQEFI